MKRAVVVYLENKRELMLEFGCLYSSWHYVNRGDTDMVVFGTESALARVPNDCLKVPMDSMANLPEWQGYGFINSLGCLVGSRADFLDSYDLILRTDVDTFLTPAWNGYIPNHYAVGKGGYINAPEVPVRIRDVAAKLGYNHRSIHNIGSTHYGDARLVRAVCKEAVDISMHMLHHEFEGIGEWPGWWKGVTSLYASEIAVNHLVKQIQLDNERLDVESYRAEAVSGHPHLHCWRTYDVFSKLDFVAGKYDGLSVKGLNLNTVRDYCLFMALKTRRDMPWLALHVGQ